jgi:hypothetical protein
MQIFYLFYKKSIIKIFQSIYFNFGNNTAKLQYDIALYLIQVVINPI